MEPRFDSATSSPDPGGCLPGCEYLRSFIFSKWTQHRGDAGCYLHNGVTDSGRPSFHSRGRAIDIWIATGYKGVGTEIFNWCYANRNEIGLNEVIFNWRIWRADNLSAGIHPYTVNAHTDHIHIAINEDGGHKRLPFYSGGATQSPPPPPKPIILNKEPSMYYAMFMGYLHKFWIDPRNFHLMHDYGQANPEDLTGSREPFVAETKLQVFLQDNGTPNPTIHVGGVASNGRFLEHRFFGGWVMEVWPK